MYLIIILCSLSPPFYLFIFFVLFWSWFFSKDNLQWIKSSPGMVHLYIEDQTKEGQSLMVVCLQKNYVFSKEGNRQGYL